MTHADARTLRQLDQAVTDARNDDERKAQQAIRDAFRRVIALRDGETTEEDPSHAKSALVQNGAER
ncbi:MAG TPA: hypothetical protein VFZ21_31695 [Gemmatimonadaceae bacterium]|nr:hypothetical protein [Gemmatimonadaceae bacterium]